MKRFHSWFTGLTRVGKFGLVTAVAVSSLVVISAAASPSTTPPAPVITPLEQQNTPIVTTRTETETKVIPFEKQTVESSSLAKGQTKVQTAGVDGIKTITYTITLTNGVETGRSSAEVVTLAPVSEVTIMGTYVAPQSNCNPNYSGCLPNVSYDLDCPDIRRKVQVIGYDQYRLDADHDGWGCESY